MSDDLRIPMPGSFAGRSATISSSYRPRRTGDDRMRAMTFAAAGLGGVLLLGMGGWSLMGRKPAEVPVIEADARPLRVKPENPGGQQFAGAEEQVMGGQASGAQRMAPVAEVPAPQALRAQMQPITPPAPAAPAAPSVPAAAPLVAPAAPAAQPTAAGPAAPGVSPLPDTPQRASAARTVPAAPAAAATNKPAAAAVAAGTMVQLAALDSEAAAQAEWGRLAKRMPDLLGGKHLVVQKAERDGKPVWRVRTGGFTDTADATGFCGKLRAKGASCTVASF